MLEAKPALNDFLAQVDSLFEMTHALAYYKT